MIDVLVISHACFTAINRTVYRLLVQEGIQTEIVVPKSLAFPGGRRNADPENPDDPKLHFLELRGNNPRTYFFEDLDQLLNYLQPANILLDNDPVSKMAVAIGKWCTTNRSNLYCITNENLSLNVIATVRRRGIRSLPAALYKRWLLYASKKHLTGVFAINNDGKKIFEKEGFKNVVLMPLGFNPHYFFVSIEDRITLRSELKLTKLTFAYFGRLVPEKGIHILINALKDLQNYSWQVVMDEFDEYASDYNQKIQALLNSAGIIERVVFVSPDHFGIGRFMNATDVIIVPSVSSPNWKEQYGRVAAEAMACGRLVVASDSGALPDLLNQHGILFKEGDTKSLRLILEKILKADTRSLNLPSESEIAAYAKKELSILHQKEVMLAQFNKQNKNKLAGV